MIYHIVSKTDWQNAEHAEFYRGDTLDTEGFIHCSALSQVIDTANFIFQGRSDLLILSIDPNKLSAEVKYEDAGDGRLFPHIYGPMETAAVQAVTVFPCKADGMFELPKELG